MAILRVTGDISPALQIELQRETEGESVNWAGRALSLSDRLQGWAIVAGGAIFALANAGGPLAALGLGLDLVERGRLPVAGYGQMLFGVIGFAAGIAIAVFGWRAAGATRPVLWAVTDKRLLRLIAGAGEPASSWSRKEILSAERLNWDVPVKRALALTVRAKKDRSIGVTLVGPADLEAADRAITNLT